jgi:hypothetical protein
MPHAKKCPHCNKKVWDWYMEWYPLAQRTDIFNGKAAMDCPWCRNPVIFDNRTETISPAPQGLAAYQRDETLAATSASLRGYPNLEAFLVNPTERATATPFRLRYWPNIDLPVKKA